MKKYQLGEFEEIVILTIAVLYKEAYSVAIKNEIETRLARNVSMGAMHTALVRLEEKGYIKSFSGDTNEDRMGRPRRYYHITALGKKAMEYSRNTRNDLWNSIPKVALDLKMVMLFIIVSITVSCTGDHYTSGDFKNVKKIDTHFHFNAEDSVLVNLARENNFLLLTINVDSHSGTSIDEQEIIARALTNRYPLQVQYLSTFGLKGWPKATWRDSTLSRLKNSFDHGALGIKIWKNVGIEERDSTGKFIMLDDPAFDPVFQLLIDQDKTLLGHLGEPKNCWLPLDQMTVNNDRDYFKSHPEYHMFLHPEYPKYEEIIAARDHVLEKHPNLRFVGAHLGSLEWDLDELAKRLDKFPNMAVDMAARIPHLQYLTQKDREKVRTFFDRYQDRIIYATDNGIGPDSNPEKTKAHVNDVWLADWKFFTSDETLSSPHVNGEFQGLNLDKKIIDKIYRENAIRWFKIGVING
jgi:DNA-binding PadR family transcriptional regulator